MVNSSRGQAKVVFKVLNTCQRYGNHPSLCQGPTQEGDAAKTALF